ncbi:MAG TPA: S53 family peptidase [Fimbriimonadaceae bacterium]|jgi:subtilase family serine protease
MNNFWFTKGCAVGYALMLSFTIAAAQSYYHGDSRILVPESTRGKGDGSNHTNYLISNTTVLAPGTAFANPDFLPDTSLVSGYTPATVRTGYNLPSTGGSGAIAVVVAYDFPTALGDFNYFSSYFSLPIESSSAVTATTNKSFQIVYATGTKPASGLLYGWCGEAALDMEWTHAIAPNAKIYLVEAASDSNADLDYAVSIAAALPGVKEISISWGLAEISTEMARDITYEKVPTGVVVFATTGDESNVDYPAASPYVVAVGGTTLHVSPTVEEYAWDGTGGGISAYESRPAFQDAVEGIVGSKRGTPDVAAIADPSTGVAVYSSSAFAPSPDWEVLGGTSVSCPVYAAITNLRGYFTRDSVRENERIYHDLGGSYFRDIIYGQSANENAAVGYDLCTGVGSAVSLFPTYTTKLLSANSASIYNRYGSSTQVSESTILAALASNDGNAYSITSVPTSLGQEAGMFVSFAAIEPFSGLVSATFTMTSKAPAGAALSVNALDYNKSDKTYGSYVLQGSLTVASSTPTISITLRSSFISSGNTASIVVGVVRPPSVSSAAFTYSVDSISLLETEVPAWDINAPL